MSNPVIKKVPFIVFAIGIVLFILNPMLGAIFGASGALILAVSQVRYLAKNEGIMGLLVPTKSMFKEMSSAEALPFKIGVAMFLSPLLAVIVKTIIVHANS